jgi:dTDP-4-dehydrorhamnose reductase
LGVNNFLNFKDQLNFKLIYISTGSVFQEIKSSKIKIDEKSKTSPKSLYAITKRLGELLVENSFKKKKILLF